MQQIPNIASYIQPVSPFMQPPISFIPSNNVSRSEITTMVVISAMVVIILFILYKHMMYSNIVEDEGDNFKSKFENETVDGLTKCGWEVYVSPSCPYCIRQKAILSEFFPNFKNIYTDRPAEVVPTWFNTKTQEKKPGMQPVEVLNMMARC